jgi:hypothetical protein
MTLVIMAWLGILGLVATLVGAAALSIERNGTKLRWKRRRSPRERR